jgi:CubicO group peptidase (beta-lactamase class C family)
MCVGSVVSVKERSLKRREAVTAILGSALALRNLSVSAPAFAQVDQSLATLPIAVLTGDLEAIQRHIVLGSDLNQRDDFGSTPLVIASVFDKPDVAEALLAAGADPTLVDANGSNALHIAAFLGRRSVVRALLDAGADRYLRSATGSTAYDYAAAPLDEDQIVFDELRAGLGPLGFRLEDAELATAKPIIAEMLRPLPADLTNVDFTPIEREDFQVSSPEAEDLDPLFLAELFREAEALPRIFSVLVVKNGMLVAERYFNDGGIDEPTLVQSAAKSIYSSFVGLALREGCIQDLDARLVDFVPEISGQLTDPRKREITIRHLLQMRSGLLWEETDPSVWDQLLEGNTLASFRDFPLVADPGTQFNYSNLSTTLLGVVVATACNRDLDDFADEHLLRPLGVEFGEWVRGEDHHHPLIHITPRTAARFAQLYLDGGAFGDAQVVPSEWVSASIQDYSPDAWVLQQRLDHAGRYLRELGYGYQWWQAGIRDRRINFAWGHGGQFYGIVHDQNLVIVVTAYPAWLEHDDQNWTHEQSHLNLAGKFISLLPQNGR